MTRRVRCAGRRRAPAGEQQPGDRAVNGRATLTAAAGSSADGREPVTQQFGDVSVEIGDDFVALVEIHRPPSNFFDVNLIRSLAEAYTTLDADTVLPGHPAGLGGQALLRRRRFQRPEPAEALPQEGANSLYREAVRLFHAETPVVAVVQGAAVGGGLGLACSADFRVAAPEARFSANFAQLGFHHGFGLTVTLPLITGHQRALELLYLGRRISGEDAYRIGLCDRLVPLAEVRDQGRELAAEIATSGPLAMRSIRQTMRGHLADAVAAATDREDAEQVRLRTDQRLRRRDPGHGRAAAAPLHRPSERPRPPVMRSVDAVVGVDRRRGRPRPPAATPMIRAKIRSALRVISP